MTYSQSQNFDVRKKDSRHKHQTSLFISCKCFQTDTVIPPFWTFFSPERLSPESGRKRCVELSAQDVDFPQRLITCFELRTQEHIDVRGH